MEATEKITSAEARDRVMADLKTLAHDAEDLLKATAGDVSEKAKEARARVAAALERAKASTAHLQEQTVVVAKKADTIIRNHPYESIGIAFGIGLLLGVVVSRK